MCGSGTFPIEAALIATNTAPGLFRDPSQGWPFVRWHDYEGAAWQGAWQAARAAKRKWGGVVMGNDIHEVRGRELAADRF
jgi:putative N6-adenine-specific DNA methylase